jgi:hypothetical protein
MDSVVNLFSNLTKEKSINDSASEYKTKNIDLYSPTPGLSQGEKFKKYQKKVIGKIDKLEKTENKTDIMDSKEGFHGIEDTLDLDGNGLTNKSNTIVKNNDYTTQQETIDHLRQQYDNTLIEYENLLSQITGSTTGYLNRVNPKNPYLGRNVQFTNGTKAYVTYQGVVKPYPSDEIYQQTAEKNGCSNKTLMQINLAYLSSYTLGSTIPTQPQLIVGTPMQLGQSCGNEGNNVFVNKLVNDPKVTYKGCYNDNTASPLMTFIGGAPPTQVNLQNGNFSQPQISKDTYQFINSSSTVPGWQINALLFNNIGFWGYPLPYPSGNQCVAIYGPAVISQSIYLYSGTYNLSFTSSGSKVYGSASIDIYCGSSKIYTFTPRENSWQQYNTTINITSSDRYVLSFKRTNPDAPYWQNAGIQNIKLVNGNSSSGSGTFTYSECQTAAIDRGYQYFALQNVNTPTSKGYCSVGNSEISAKSLGEGLIPNGQKALWASNTNGQTGNTAILKNTGTLSVLNSNGQSIFNTNSSRAQPSNYLGCYGDGPNRAMPLFNRGSQQYNLQQCQQIAQQTGSNYFGLQNSTSGRTAQCALSNDISKTTSYGVAKNCTKIGDGSWSGGGWSNAVYNTNTPDSNYFLILQDDGNLCIYRGTSPSDNQGYIWCSMTNGKQQQSNPNFAAVNGKYGKNWISQGSTLAAGDFVGSTNGNMALIMQGDGNLVLYTFTNVSNCTKMTDGNTGGGVGANALYNILNTGFPSNIGKLAYIDQNAELHPYPSTNAKYSNYYTKIPGTDSSGNDIPGSAYGNATLQSCEKSCNSNEGCAGFAYTPGNNVCYPKTANMYPNGAKNSNSNVDLYVRSKTPNTPPIGVPSTVKNVDSISFQNYVHGGAIGNTYGLANINSVQKQQLTQLQGQLDQLSSQIIALTGKFGDGNTESQEQTKANVLGIQNYLKGIDGINNKIHNFDTNFENILKDSDIVVLQKNYNYLVWSILAIGTVIVSMNIVNKNA